MGAKSRSANTVFLRSVKSNHSGYTLIEALIVIAIIGILATLIIISCANVQAKARDARRKSDLTGLGQEFEARHLTKLCSNSTDIGLYPGMGFANGSSNGWQLVSALAGKSDSCGSYSSYLTTIPSDPLSLRSNIFAQDALAFGVPTIAATPTSNQSNQCNVNGSANRNYQFNLSLDGKHYRLGALLEINQSSTQADRDRLSIDWSTTPFSGSAYANATACTSKGSVGLNYFVGN
jgi:prepilin-type N-terminal cleavage/methylation domain-containing protein